MLERYRTLGAMLALGEFRVSELAALSEVQESTVRTILRRESRYVEEIGIVPTGRRGGQPVRWRLRAETREHLRIQLQELERQGVGPWLGERQDASHVLSAGLIAAEDVLLRLAPATSDPVERPGLIKLARAHVDAADASGSVVPASAVRAAGHQVALHRRIVELLLDLEEIERLSDRSSLSRAGGILIDLLLAVGKADDERLTDAIRKRLALSPFTLFRDPAAANSPAHQPDVDESELVHEVHGSEAVALDVAPFSAEPQLEPKHAYPQDEGSDQRTQRHSNCPHTPQCPDASSPDREAARTIVSHPEQGWSLLCNGIVVFEDTGELLPDGNAIEERPAEKEERSAEQWLTRRSGSAS